MIVPYANDRKPNEGRLLSRSSRSPAWESRTPVSDLKRQGLNWLICTACSLLLLAGCNSPTSCSLSGSEGTDAWKTQFRIGVRSAEADRDRGILAWDANDNGEWEEYRILWCYRKLLSEKYHIPYRLRGHLHPNENAGRIAGYQSVMNLLIGAKLGDEWKERIYAEAAALYQTNWKSLERQFYIDERGQPGYDLYVNKHPISEEEHRGGNPLNADYDYRG